MILLRALWLLGVFNLFACRFEGLLMRKIMNVVLMLSMPLMVYGIDRSAVQVTGLLKETAVIMVSGHQHVLKVGESTPEGVKLISSNSKGAVLEINGERIPMKLTRVIGTRYKEPEQQIVRLSSRFNGHFLGSAKINGYSVQVLVDTGASVVAMSEVVAKSMRIDYKRGQPVQANTAQGVTNGYQVNLMKVSVGNIEVTNVSAIVIEGKYPLDVLLGNSFLSKLNMRIENGVLELRSKY